MRRHVFPAASGQDLIGSAGLVAEASGNAYVAVVWAVEVPGVEAPRAIAAGSSRLTVSPQPVAGSRVVPQRALSSSSAQISSQSCSSSARGLLAPSSIQVLT
jgi:hypothetical protein